MNTFTADIELKSEHLTESTATTSGLRIWRFRA
jgi:hypothetical protein